MGNLSKIKRESMLTFLGNLRKQYEDDSVILTIKDIERELIKTVGNSSEEKKKNMLHFLRELKAQYEDINSIYVINDIESSLTKTKHGLVWEEHEERVDVEIKTKVPVFSEVLEKEITTDSNLPYNFLLEGDNLHSLYLLEKTHKEKVDIALLDPPYNTGNKDFKYDDCYLSQDDDFKHSKWLSFMEKRLRIVYNLLKDSGMIIIHIDEKEFSQLKMLCDDLFGSRNYIGEFIWKARSGKGGTNSLIAMQHEYILCYAKNISNINFRQDVNITDKETLEHLRQWGQGVYRKDRPTMFFPILKKGGEFKLPTKEEYEKIYVDEVFQDDYLEELRKKYESNGFEFILPYTNGEYGRWRKGYNGVQELIDNKLLVVTLDKYGNKFIKKIIPADKESTVAIDSMLLDYGSASTGTLQLKELFDNKKVFDTTKPIEVEKFLLNLGVYNNPEAIVLDCFAGSGTTGHAVMELNKEDGGNRKFILCTNNESGICEKVTYEKLKKLIQGYTFKGKKDTILLEKKITLQSLKNANKILEEIEKVKLENNDKFDKINPPKIVNGVLKITGSNKQNNKVDGINANLKYYKTNYIDKLAEDDRDAVTDELLAHMVEMVQLEHFIKIDNSEYVIILTDNDVDNIEKNIECLKKCKGMYVSSRVLLTKSQEMLFNNLGIELIYIPEYYFDKELRDMGELCLC